MLAPILCPKMSQTMHNFNTSIGYSPNAEDLDVFDTEYMLPDDLTELDEGYLNIMHLNIRGALNKQESLSRLLSTMGGMNKVNVVSLNETWLRKETKNKIYVPGHHFIGKNRSGRKGGGVGFLVSEELRYREFARSKVIIFLTQ